MSADSQKGTDPEAYAQCCGGNYDTSSIRGFRCPRLVMREFEKRAAFLGAMASVWPAVDKKKTEPPCLQHPNLAFSRTGAADWQRAALSQPSPPRSASAGCQISRLCIGAPQRRLHRRLCGAARAGSVRGAKR